MVKDEYLELVYKIKMNMFSLLKNGKSGHIGGSLSVAEVLTAIYYEKIKGKKNKLIFSKGHCEIALYSVFLEDGILDFKTINELKEFKSPMQGHPSARWIDEVTYSSGSLGQGLSFAVGMAISGKMNCYDIYAIIGDGEMQEGQVWEAIMVAPHYNLDNLTVVVDCNKLQLEGETLFVNDINKMMENWANFGWKVDVIENGNDIEQVLKMLSIENEYGKPKVLFANTVKGNGVSYMESNSDFHGTNLTSTEITEAMKQIKK